MTLARGKVFQHKLLQFLESKEPAWKDKDHPELANNTAAWVRKLRKESELSRRSKKR
jgi:hypothetical protein